MNAPVLDLAIIELYLDSRVPTDARGRDGGTTAHARRDDRTRRVPAVHASRETERPALTQVVAEATCTCGDQLRSCSERRASVRVGE